MASISNADASLMPYQGKNITWVDSIASRLVDISCYVMFVLRWGRVRIVKAFKSSLWPLPTCRFRYIFTWRGMPKQTNGNIPRLASISAQMRIRR
jgi:hypothetical protein